MGYISNAADIVRALQKNINTQIHWLKRCQILVPESKADGAITRYPDQGWINPYFANFSAMAILEETSSYPLVERYLNWYLRNLEKNGTILDFHYDESLQASTSRPDSEDAYAASYLSLVAGYHKKTGRTEWVRENLSDLKKVARSIVNLMDRDGLTFALASYRVKYLMDNCEVYRGLADFADILANLGDKESAFYQARAKEVANGIERELWNRRHFYYHPNKAGWRKPGVNLKKFYPDAGCQVFPVLYGLIEPDSERGIYLNKIFNEHQPDWVYIKPPDYPWMILGYHACLHGDYKLAYEKARHVRETYIQDNSPQWFCAEAAFFVQTCASLIRNKEQWLTV